jgi:hypothetical protein
MSLPNRFFDDAALRSAETPTSDVPIRDIETATRARSVPQILPTLKTRISTEDSPVYTVAYSCQFTNEKGRPKAALPCIAIAKRAT